MLCSDRTPMIITLLPRVLSCFHTASIHFNEGRAAEGGRLPKWLLDQKAVAVNVNAHRFFPDFFFVHI